MGTDICLYGGSGHCKVVIGILQSNKESISAIIDDNPKEKKILGIPVIRSNVLECTEDLKVIVAIGNNRVRKKVVNKLFCNFHVAIHSKSIISDFSKIGIGSMVMAGVIINEDAVVGKHCIINTAAIIEHDCVIGDFVHVSPNVSLAGGVSVGEGSHIGIGATVIQQVKIGKWATIGAGAVIIKDVPDYAVIVGNPGRIIKYNHNE